MFVLIALAASCGGGDSDDAGSTTATDSSSDAAASTEVEETTEALPPLSSVPFGEYGTSHVGPPVSFETSPSTGGDHYQFWQNCGYYTTEVIEGAATHTLEHGAVWITYNESAVSGDDLAALEALASGNGKLLISPYNHDDAIVLSAWGVQQRGVPAPSTAQGSAEISAFIEAWADNPELAEAGVPCDRSAGVPPDSPRVFPDGQEIPDDFG